MCFGLVTYLYLSSFIHILEIKVRYTGSWTLTAMICYVDKVVLDKSLGRQSICRSKSSCGTRRVRNKSSKIGHFSWENQLYLDTAQSHTQVVKGSQCCFRWKIQIAAFWSKHIVSSHEVLTPFIKYYPWTHAKALLFGLPQQNHWEPHHRHHTGTTHRRRREREWCLHWVLSH